MATEPGLFEIGGKTFRLPPSPQVDEKTHVYRHPENGDQLPSVTRIMAAAGMGFQWSNEQAAKRGKRVHLATMLDDQGELDEDSVRTSDWPFLRAYREARARHQMKPILREHPVMQKLYRFAGRLDWLGMFPIGSSELPAIMDIKTGTASWYWWVQQTGYLLCFPDHRQFMRICLELHDDGTYRLFTRTAATWTDDLSVWMAALTIYGAKESK